MKSESWCSECGMIRIIHGAGKYPPSLLETKRLSDVLGLRLTETESGEVFLLLPTSQQNYQLQPCMCGRMIRIQIDKPAGQIHQKAVRPLKNRRSLSSHNRNGSDSRKNG